MALSASGASYNFINAAGDENEALVLADSKMKPAVSELQVHDRTLQDRWEHIVNYHTDYEENRAPG